MEKARKKPLKKALGWISLALVVLILTLMPLMARSEAEAEGPQESILSGTVEKKDISFSLHGGGSLEASGSEEVKLPEGVRITEFLVKNGDMVEKGDPVAAVDKVSVMTAITELTETLEYLQDQIDSSANDKVSAYVTAPAGGRVKEIYAQAGDSVQEVMLEHGALAVLSLDGKMALELEAPAATGDSVELTFPDGTTVPGRVESSLEGKILVSVEDKGYAPGEAVTVRKGGNTIGSGTLFIHSPWKATAFTGTVSTVSAKKEATVYDGATLFTLKDTDFTAQLESAASLHREYEQLLQELFQMYETGVIPSPCDGLVSGVDRDSPFLLSGEIIDWEAVPLAAEETKGWTVMLLSNPQPAPTEPVPTETTPTETVPEETLPLAKGIGYAGKVTQVGINGLILTMNPTPYPVTQKAEGGWDLGQVSLDPMLMIAANVLYPTADVAGYTAGDLVVILFDESGNLLEMVTAQKAQPQEPTTPDFGGLDFGAIMGAMGGGISGMGGMPGSVSGYPGTTQSQGFDYFDLEGTTLLTVTNQEQMKLTITLDEQDIAQVEAGQVAEVTLEALPEQVFEAEVTKVSLHGAGGGSSKFTVELTLPKEPNMLPGMSAAASIPLYTQMQIPAVPTAALVDLGAQTVVCTALDEKTGAPADPVTVITGVSDGEYTQIKEGLNLGDAFHYTYYDTLELDTSAQESRFGF